MSQKFAKIHPQKTILWKEIGAIHCQVVLPGPLVMTVPILVPYSVSISTSLVPQLQLCHFQWLVYEESVGSRTHNCRRCYTLYLTETLLQLSEPISVWVMSAALREHQLQHYKHRQLRACRSIHLKCISS